MTSKRKTKSTYPKAKPNGKPGKTSVTFLLDRSGSMEAIKGDTIGAFNAYLDGLQGADIEFSLVQFDSMSLDKVYVRVPVAQATKLDNNNYQPRGGTPLIDASYKTIKAVEHSLQGESTTKVVICIQTDGHENASTEYTWEQLNALIKEKTALGWQFNFMGASIDAYSQGARMGISAGQTVSYNAQNTAATMDSFLASASNARSFAAGQSVNTNYSAQQKSASGDIFDPAKQKQQSGNTKHPAQQVQSAVTQKLKPKERPAAVDDFKL